MNVQDYLSDDGQAMLALCSAFGLKEAGEVETSPQPFKLSEWNQFEKQLSNSAFKSPASLQGQSASELAKDLALASEEAERIVRLLERSGRLALELENLFS